MGIFRRMLVLLSAVMVSGLAFADAGFHETDAVKVTLTASGSDKEMSLNLTNQSSYDLGTVTSLKLKSFLATVWKKDGGNVCNVTAYYVVYPKSTRYTDFKNYIGGYKDGWTEGGATHQHWGGDVNKDLCQNLPNDDYVLEMYFKAQGDQNGGGCNDGAFEAINGGENYKFNFKYTGSSSDCSIQSRGDAIPANTVIFFDNSANIFSSEIWVSVPTESGNGNSGSIDQGSYVKKKDKWYKMVNIGNNVWQASITTASSYGRMSFWEKDGSAATDVWQNTVVFQVPYKTGKNLVIPVNTKCRNDNRETDYYTQTTLSTLTGLVLSTSVDAIRSTDTNPVTLTATAIGISGTTYKFEKRAFDSDTWTTIATQESDKYVLYGAELPVKTTYYRVSYGSVISEEVKLSVLIDCEDGGSSKNILKYDFGLLPALKGTTSRRSDTDMAKDYTFQPYGYKVNDGYYAVVATPYYCGCGEGSNMTQTVDQCEGNNMWFRNIYDHTIGEGGTTGGKYGAMLFINFSDRKSKTAYQHTLTADEKAAFVKGSTLSFSAWFASAAKKEATDVMINMALKIEYKPAGSSESAWQSLAVLENKVKYDDNWKLGKASIDIDDPNGDYRVIIDNYSRAGTGNDALIDDISLDLCVPTFPVDYYDLSTDKTYRDYTFPNVNENQTVRILKQDYGHGENNCVLLMMVDVDRAVGTAGRYKVLKTMNLTSIKGVEYYTADVNPMELMGGIPNNGSLQVVVVPPTYCQDENMYQTLVEKLEGGQIKPLDSSDYLFSTNLLTYNMTCNANISATLNGNATVCVDEGKKDADMPTIDVTFGHITDYVFYNLIEDDNYIATDVEVSADQVKAGKFSIDMNTIQGVVRTAGTHKFIVEIYEMPSLTTANKICVKQSAALEMTMVPVPTYTDLPSLFSKCDGVAKSITITAQNVKTYFWMIKKGASASWESTGVDQATYTIPAEAETGWQVKVGMSNGVCTDVYSNTVTIKSDGCEAVSLTLTPDVSQLCRGDEVSFSLSAQNLGSLATDVKITEDIAALNNLVFVSATPSMGTFSNHVWSISGMAVGATATMTLKYKAKAGTGVKSVEKVYVSQLATTTWNSYDEQTDENMKQSVEVTVKEVSDTPVLSDPYNECRVEGTKDLADFVKSDRTDLQWYSDADLTQVVSPAVFDMDVVVADKKYFVTNTETDKCVSDAAEASVTVRDNPSSPLTKGYKDCATDNKLNLQTLIINYSPNYEYSYYQGETTLNDGTVDVSVPGKTTYSVAAKLDGCQSGKSDMLVVVKDYAVASDIDIDDKDACKGSSITLTASSSTVTPNPIFTWYKDAALTDKISTGATYKVRVTENVTYYVSVQNDDYCENRADDGQDVSIKIKTPVSSVVIKENPANVHPSSASDKIGTEEYVNGIPTFTIALGSQTEKLLYVEPDVPEQSYTVKWYSNGKEFDAEFPSQPYIDQIYKVVLVDECGTSHEAQAVTNVMWPTVITPQVVDGYNDDFVVGMDKPFEIKVFDRTGNMVYQGSDGWPNESAAKCMPGVYYYVVELPDNMGVKKGNVEIYKVY